MPSVYRKSITRPLSNSAEVVLENGQRRARWRDRCGERRSGVIIERADGSLRVRVLSATYVAKYRDGEGVVREVSTGCRTKQAALVVLSDHVRRAENVRAGVVSAADDALRDWLDTPVADSLSDYLGQLRGRGRSPQHVEDCRRLTTRVLSECGAASLRQVKAASIERWLAARMGEGISPRTRNSYLSAVRSFCRWCVTAGRLADDPTARIPKLSEAVDRRRRRRSMTAEELGRLLEATTWRPLAEYGRAVVPKRKDQRAGKRDTWTRAPLVSDDLHAAVERARERLAGNPELIARLERRGRGRALVYKVMVLTGLRRGELASLAAGALRLEVDPPRLVLEAAGAENTQAAEIPLRQDLADDLRTWVAERSGAVPRRRDWVGSRLVGRRRDAAASPLSFPLLDVPKQMTRGFDADLAAAGIAKRDDRGRTLDVHALRHSFGSLLSAGGVAPRTAQAALRHSSIHLTMNVYTDPRVLDVAGALERLPPLPLSPAPIPAAPLPAVPTRPSSIRPSSIRFAIKPLPIEVQHGSATGVNCAEVAASGPSLTVARTVAPKVALPLFDRRCDRRCTSC